MEKPKYLSRAYVSAVRVITCPCGEFPRQDMYYSFSEGEIPNRENCKKEVALAVCKCNRVYFALLPRALPKREEK